MKFTFYLFRLIIRKEVWNPVQDQDASWEVRNKRDPLLKQHRRINEKDLVRIINPIDVRPYQSFFSDEVKSVLSSVPFGFTKNYPEKKKIDWTLYPSACIIHNVMKKQAAPVMNIQ